MTRTTRTFRIPVTATSTAPTWWTNQTTSTWSTPVSNTISAVLPNPVPPGSGPEAICTAWTGACVDQTRREYILAANGGHTDYAGNEVYACDLGSPSPQWRRLRDPTPTAQITGGDSQNANETYADGQPRSMHGWNRCEFGNGRVWYGGMGGMYPNGAPSTMCISWNRNAAGNGPFPLSSPASPWTLHGRITYGNGADWQLGPVSYDRVTQRLWVLAQYSNDNNMGYYVDTTAGTPTPIPFLVGDGGIQHSWGVIPHNLGRIWITKSKLSNELSILNLTNPTAGFTNRPISIVSGSISAEHGAVYHQATQSIYCWHSNGSSVIRITVPNDPFTGTFTQTLVAAAAGGTTPSAGRPEGTFKRFNIIDDMGDGRSALMVVNAINQPVYVYKLPAS